MEVLHIKHPDACLPTAAILDTYPDRPPELVPVDINDDTVTEMKGRIYGGAGTGRTDSVILQHWLLRLRVTSGELRLIVV